MIKASDVWYSFGEGYAVKGVSITVAEGEAYAVMGPNGAGKSTLLKLLAGILKPKKGDVYVCGYNSKSFGEPFLARFVGYVPQNPWLAVFKPSVREEILFTALNLGIAPDEAEKSLVEVASRLGIAGLLNRSPYTLSEGEIRRVVLASALIHKPKVLLLDEPTAGLDYRLKKAFINMVKELIALYRVSLVIATHDVEILPMLTGFRIVLMMGGSVVLNTTVDEVLRRPEAFERVGLLPPTVSLLLKKLNALDEPSIRRLANPVAGYRSWLAGYVCR